MSRHAQDNLGFAGRRLTNRARMAGGTIQPHLVHAQSPASRNTDGQIFARLIDKPERSVSPWQFVGTDGGQDPEDPIRGENPTYGAQEWAARLAAVVSLNCLDAIG